MKMTKKIASLLLIGVLMLSLSACKEEPVIPKDSHLDWIYVPEAPNAGALTKDGYYYSEDGILKYADIAAGKSTVLCARPGCAHKEDDYDNPDNPCDAAMPFWGRQILFENDTMYYRGDANVLYARDATGGALKELGVMAKELIDEGKSVHARPLAVCNGYVYYEGDIKESKPHPSGGTVSAISGTCIGRFNIAQRKDEILVLSEDKDYSGGIRICAARENGVIYVHYEGIGPEEDWENVDADKRAEAAQKAPIHIKHLNPATGETTTLFTVTAANFKSVCCIENGKIYYTKNLKDGNSTFEVHSYDLVTGKNTLVFTDVAPLSLGKGYWQCTKWLDAKTAQRHIYDANTGKTLPYELKDNLGVMNYSQYGLVVLNPITGVYSFLSYDSLADGLQESDLKFLYSNS